MQANGYCWHQYSGTGSSNYFHVFWYAQWLIRVFFSLTYLRLNLFPGRIVATILHVSNTEFANGIEVDDRLQIQVPFLHSCWTCYLTFIWLLRSLIAGITLCLLEVTVDMYWMSCVIPEPWQMLFVSVSW